MSIAKWHPYAQLFPMLEGEDWVSFCNSVKATNGIADNPILYRHIPDERGAVVKEGLDGRNRLKACEKLGIEPTYKAVAIPDADCIDFIKRHNIHRRHMDAKVRKALVASLRKEGMSTRAISESTGIPQSTVAADVQSNRENPTDQNGSVEVEPPKVTGKNNKSYDPSKPDLRCGRCKRTFPNSRQSTPNCQPCVEEKKAAKSGREPGSSNRAPNKPKQGVVLFDFKAFEKDFGAVVRHIDKLGNAYKCKESKEAKALRKQLADFHQSFKEWHKAVKS